MLCCLNPECANPINPDHTQVCLSCGQAITPLLRNRYQPINVLGQGGFGRTYLAQDSDRLNTRCVIKQFNHQSANERSFEKAVQLFNQEALRLNDLGEHSQIPTLLAYFEQDNRLYLVQQVIEGQTLLEEVAHNGPFNENQIRTLLIDLLPVLDFVHQHKVVHRDINPSNIIRRQSDGKPVLIDFGIAKQFEESLGKTQIGTRIGTEGYSPIEQLRSGEAYASSDLYSLGATCLFLLTACKPENLYSALEGRWLWREKLQANGRSVGAQLSQILDRLVKDLISERYVSANDVLKELKTLPSSPQSVPGWTRQTTGGSGAANPTANTFISHSLFSHSDAGKVSAPNFPPTQPPSRPPVPASSGTPSGSSGTPSGPSSGRSSGQSSGQLSGQSGGRSVSGPTSAAGSSTSRWRCTNTFSAHKSWVSSIAFNPVLPMLASGSLDDTIKIWDIETGELTHSLSGHSRGINALVFSPKGQVLASCSDDHTVKVWNVGAGNILYTLQGHARDVTAIDIGSQGNLLVSSSEDRTIRLWKLDRGGLLKTLSGNVGMIKCVRLTPDEQFIVSGGFDNKIRIWQSQSGENLKTLSGHLNTINDLAISTDGRLIASASKDKTIRLWSLRSGNLVQTLQGHNREVNAVVLTPDQSTVISAGADSTIKVWDSKTGELVETLMSHGGSVTAVAISHDGQYMASASADKTIKLWAKV
jgi:WD40 repeat protein